jgi:hypothetical protein
MQVLAFFCSFSGLGFSSGRRRFAERVWRRRFEYKFRFRRTGGRWLHYHAYAGHFVH